MPTTRAAFPDWSAPEREPRLRAHVDSRVELLSLIFRLAGNIEYNQPASKSPYADEVEKHFGSFSNHSAVRKAKSLRRWRGIGYDAVMSLAVHLEDTVNLKTKTPLDPLPARLDGRWRPADARKFLERLRVFVEQTGFQPFFDEHAELYAVAGQRLTAKLNERAYLKWFDEFFGARPGARFEVLIGMLNGPCNYGVSVRCADGREEITPVLGASKFDADGIPVFDDSIIPTVVHELCHSYTNPIVDRFADELKPAAEQLYRRHADQMQRQAYGNWKTMMYESLVRVCVVRYLHATDGEAAAREEINAQHERGFVWTGDLSNLLAEYETHRDRYGNFDAFMPRVVEFLDDYASAHADDRAP